MEEVNVKHQSDALKKEEIIMLICAIIFIYLFGFWKGILMVLIVLGVYTSLSLQKWQKKGVFNIGMTPIINPYAGIFICGGAGSGKSKSIIEPLIKQSGEKGYTGVVYDYKFPELASYVATAYTGSKVKAYYFSLDDLEKSSRINPINPDIMNRESYAREFAYTILVNLNPQMISKADFWSDNSVALLSATFWYLKVKYPQYCTLPHAISMILQPNYKALLFELQAVDKSAEMIAPILTAYEQGADNQLAGVLSSLQVSLSKINIDEIYYLMTANDFDLRINDEDKKGVVVLGNNPQLSSTYAPLIGLILASISKQLNRQDKEKSIFMIDEFPTVYIPNVEQLPATARSNKVATILACQDIAQLSDKYGQVKAETILSNLGNQFYGRTTNPATAKRVSEIFGKQDREVFSISKKSFDLDSTKTYSTRDSERVKIQEVAGLETGSFYTIVSEGKIKQGKSKVRIDKNFSKGKIPILRRHPDVESAYFQVKQEVKGILQDAINLLENNK